MWVAVITIFAQALVIILNYVFSKLFIFKKENQNNMEIFWLIISIVVGFFSLCVFLWISSIKHGDKKYWNEYELFRYSN